MSISLGVTMLEMIEEKTVLHLIPGDLAFEHQKYPHARFILVLASRACERKQSKCAPHRAGVAILHVMFCLSVRQADSFSRHMLSFTVAVL